jgi:RNA polymerase sigma-70 factor (ECF subfamily)
MMENWSDSKLIGAYFKGDKEALEVLISRYLKQVYNFVYRYLDNTRDAEDITQETFVKAWRNLKKFKCDKSFKTWIFKIAHNACLDFFRKRKTVPFSDFENEEGDNALSENLTDLAPLPEEIFDQENLVEEALAAMEKLPAKTRTVLFLHYNDQFTFQEIADLLGEPLDTVKSRHRRGLIVLREIILKNNN